MEHLILDMHMNSHRPTQNHSLTWAWTIEVFDDQLTFKYGCAYPSLQQQMYFSIGWNDLAIGWLDTSC
jgi:hypothetical protein